MLSALVSILAGSAVLVALLEWLRPAAMAHFWLGLERRRARLTPRVVRAGDLEFPYLEGGRGEPLVLVHGFGGDKDNFTRIARYLTPHFHVVIPDLPGFGDAGRDAGRPYHVAAQAERLHALIAALGLGPVHLGGNSMGGFIACEFALRFPGDVLSLWLLDPAGTQLAHATPLIAHYLETGELPLLVRRESDYGRLLRVVAHRAPLLPPSLRRTLARRAAADFPLHGRIFREIGLESPLLDDRLDGIAAPTLVVWGDRDQVLNPAAAGPLAAGLRRGRLVRMPETGHLPMIERPRTTARDYLAFVASLATPSRASTSATVTKR
ncbi:MAG: alpha/beta hydrolase [Proteobacteria bacterium]|nr:alpha/beta hydrolase [Pseudomonadota bacterium]